MMFDTSFSFKVSFVTNNIHLIEECSEIPINKRSISPVKSFEMYKAEKGSQWKGKVSKKRTENTYKKEEVTISIGLMEWNDKESKIKVKRGKRISCVVANDDIKAAILRKAVAKWKHYHKNLYDSDEMYSLLYESGEVIDKLPGSDEDFVLYKYRREIAKDYKRITLYICKNSDLEVSVLSQQFSYDTENEASSPPIKKGRADIEQRCSETKEMSSVAETSEAFTYYPDIPTNDYHSFQEFFDRSDTTDLSKYLSPLNAHENQPLSHDFLSEVQSSSKSLAPGSNTICKVHCPICNQKFPIDEIDNHANGCLDQRSNILHYDRSSSEEELQQVISQESEDFSMKSRKDILLTIESVIKSSCVIDESADPLKLNIRKNFGFEDFFHFFNKKWNCSKKNKLYEISFIGESGVDTGGLSREFYSGRLF